MNLFNLFKHGIKLPLRKSMFALNRTGMDIAMLYLFLLVFIVSIPDLVLRIINQDSLSMNLLFTTLYFFMFYYLPLVVMMLLTISAVSYVATIIAKLMKRKLRYQILLKMCIYALTVPFLVYTIIVSIYPDSHNLLWLSCAYAFIVQILVIRNYPKKRMK